MSRAIRVGPVLVALLLFGIGLGRTDLWAPDEPRYTRIADELLQGEQGPRGLVLLHLSGEPYTQKPPLYFWLAAGFGALTGHVEAVEARLPSALAGVAVIALTLGLGAAVAGRAGAGAGIWAAFVLLTLPRFVHQARRAQLDVLLTACVTAALALFWRIDAACRAGQSAARRDVALLHGAVALGVLTKGPVGLLPYAVILAYLAWEGRLRDARTALPAWGIALACAPALAWIAGAVALAPAGFFEAAVIDNVFGRFFSGTDHVRPFYYYAYQFPLDFLPWTPALLVAGAAALRDARSGAGATDEAGRAARFALSWLGVFLLFFSLSSGKRGLYMLPAFPAAALLCGTALDRRLEHGEGWRTLASGPAFALMAGCLGAGLVWAWPPPVLGWLPEAVTDRTWLGATAVLSAAALGLGLALARSRRRAAVGTLVAGLIGIQALGLACLYPALDAIKSPRAIALAAKRASGPTDTLGVYRHSAFLGGLAFYADRRTEAIETPAEARAFAARGGRTLIAKARDRAALARVLPTRVLATERSGRRRLWLLAVDTDETARR